MEFTRKDLTQAQWEFIEPIIAKPKVRPDGRGRPWRHPRAVLNGILWVLRNGTAWRELPDRYPSYQTCHRRFQQWQRDGTIEKILSHLSAYLAEQKKIDLQESFVDGTFAGAKKGDLASASRSGARARRSWSSPIATVYRLPRARRVRPARR